MTNLFITFLYIVKNVFNGELDFLTALYYITY